MRVDLRDYSNEGRLRLFITALGGETFPLYRNEGDGLFRMDTYPARIGFPTCKMSGWGGGIYDFNNDGFKDLVSGKLHVSENAALDPPQQYRQAKAVLP